MKIEQTWASQAVPSFEAEQLREVVAKHISRTTAQIRTSFVFCILCVAGAIFNFYGQFVLNGDPLLVAALRFSVVLVVIPFQWRAWWVLKRRHEERARSQLDQRSWLAGMVDDLHNELYRPVYWKLAFFSCLVIGLMIAVKWLDYRYGLDSAGEGFAIVMAVAVLILLGIVGVWLHRKNVLMPRYERYRELLESISIEGREGDSID